MDLRTAKCPKCGMERELVFSNNPLVPSICYECLADNIDVSNIEHANFFCRTYNIPFKPDVWMAIVQEHLKTKNEDTTVIKTYLKQYLHQDKNNLFYQDNTADVWKEANEEFQKVLEHRTLLDALEPVKKDFITRGQIKWGNYTFTELIQLENLFNQTIDTFDINNPFQIESVKKACKLSVAVDRAIEEGVDTKDISALITSYNAVLKTAKIEDMIDSANTDVIRNISDLVQYLEENDFKFEYYDKVERDIVDKTINILKEHTTNLVLESTGLEATLNQIKESYEVQKQLEADNEAYKALPLEELLLAVKHQQEDEIEEELLSEEPEFEADDIYIDDDEDEEQL